MDQSLTLHKLIHVVRFILICSHVYLFKINDDVFCIVYLIYSLQMRANFHSFLFERVYTKANTSSKGYDVYLCTAYSMFSS